MSFIKKFFGKKEDEDSITSDINTGFGSERKDPFQASDSGLELDSLGQKQEFDSFGNPRSQKQFPSSFEDYTRGRESQQQGMQGQGDMSKDMQIIIAKLDAIKSEVSSINHRLEALEKKEHKRMW